jgi:hypothetical protein
VRMFCGFYLWSCFLLLLQIEKALIVFELKFKSEIGTNVRLYFSYVSDSVFKSGTVFFHVVGYD